MARKATKVEPMIDDATLTELEASWPKTKELAFAIDDPLDRLMEKAHNIFAGKYWDNLDALAIRIADVCPTGVTEDNFLAAQPVAKACRSYFANVEKLRTGLNRPFLDAKKAVDEAAKATVSRAEGVLLPIITAVKTIEDRKKEEAAEAERLRLKKIEDDRLAAEKAHRDKIEAEHAAEVKRLADEKATLEAQARKMREDADRLERERKDAEVKSRAANDELAALRKQIEEMGRTPVKPAFAEAIAKAPDEAVVAVDLPPVQEKAPDRAAWNPQPLPPLFDDEPPVVGALQDILGATMVRSEEPPPIGDQQKVRDFGLAIKVFIDGLKRPALTNQEARQAVELAVFDFYGITNNLQEWSMS